MVRLGMTPPCNVTVLLLSTGMEKAVCSAQMEKFGIIEQELVNVKQELNGMVNSAQLSKIVKVEQFGTRTHGLVNVLQQLSGVDHIVLPILAQVDKFGTMLPEIVLVLEEKFSSMDIVSFLKELVPMDKFGIILT